MRLRILLEAIVYTKPGLIIASGILLLTVGLATNNQIIINTGLGFLIFGGIIGVIHILEGWGWNKIRERHKGNMN